MTEVVLASGSPSRLDLLRRAGIEPTVIVSGADETALPGEAPHDLVVRLAEAKAKTVSLQVKQGVVIGCDSLLELDGIAHGKPGRPQPAIELWQHMSGRKGTFHTGHCLIDAATQRTVTGLCSTIVTFGTPTQAEITDYIATGEPLAVAGAFKISHKGGWFVDNVEGDPGNLQGISLPLVRRLLHQLGWNVTRLWA
ncbi:MULTISPECIES: Maf family protein [Streptomyces]|uniref:Maf family protein n=1 Tax=Streptomyces TaxID=1883 RepID=UPI00237D7E49|nr:nucleoside triphosphate pyrophosphatase [Streptomyces sp. G7(2002)]WDT59130.1 Maf-like protein [Streptomyces sp. G7(2002)]